MIFLDMDGVLCDFVGAAFKLHGKEFDPCMFPRGQYALEPVLGVTTKEFWTRIDEAGQSFWEDLEPYPWAIDLVNALDQFASVVISTSPSRHSSSYAGKRRWLQKHGMHKIPSMFGANKFLMSRPGRVLVDDSERNTEMWDLHGGLAVLFPQPWNEADRYDGDIISHVCIEVDKRLQFGR